MLLLSNGDLSSAYGKAFFQQKVVGQDLFGNEEQTLGQILSPRVRSFMSRTRMAPFKRSRGHLSFVVAVCCAV